MGGRVIPESEAAAAAGEIDGRPGWAYRDRIGRRDDIGKEAI